MWSSTSKSARTSHFRRRVRSVEQKLHPSRTAKGRGATRGDQLLTSTFTLGEVLVKPLERQDDELRRKYAEVLTATSLLIPFDARAAGLYAALRSDRSLRPPDAIRLACAAAAGVDLFITNDSRLHSKHAPGVQFIVPLDRAPL